MLTRNIDVLTAVAADQGYDWEALRIKLRAENVTPLVPSREKYLRGRAKNVLIDKPTYHPRSNAESAFFGLRQSYGDTLWSRTWFGQLRQLVMKSALRKIERAIEGSTR